MQRLCRQDETAFRRLLERHLPAISRFSRRMLNTADAEDIAQETFLRLWQHAPKWKKSRAGLSTWLHTIARNLALDLLRKKVVQEQIDDEVPGQGSPDEQLTDAEFGEKVQQAISRLPERQRSALVLCHFQGFSGKEAAGILDMQKPALESLLARARKNLRKQLLPTLEQDFRP